MASLLEQALKTPMVSYSSNTVSPEEVELFLAYTRGVVRQKQVTAALGKNDAVGIYSWVHRVLMHCIHEGIFGEKQGFRA